MKQRCSDAIDEKIVHQIIPEAAVSYAWDIAVSQGLCLPKNPCPLLKVVFLDLKLVGSGFVPHRFKSILQGCDVPFVENHKSNRYFD